jgi:hypothetical protein
MLIKDYIEIIKPELSKLQFSIPETYDKCAVIVETRNIPNLDIIIKNHMFYLDGWGLIVVHWNNNEDYILDCLKDIEGVKLAKFEANSPDKYNRLLTGEAFWNMIPAEKVLIFQSDSLMLRCCVEDYLNYDYIGAPWAHIIIQGGNGGFSLRSKSACLEVIKEHKYDPSLYGNEDLYFSRFIKNIAPKHICQQFSVETIYFPKPIGIHAVDKHLKPDEVSFILTESLKEFS